MTGIKVLTFKKFSIKKFCMNNPSKFWPPRTKNAVRERISYMIRRNAVESNAFDPPLDEIEGFVIYTPDSRIFWNPDDGMAIGYSAGNKKGRYCILPPGIFVIQNQCDENEEMEFFHAGMPKNCQEFEDILFRIFVDRMNLTPEECRKACATFERLNIMKFDVTTKEVITGEVSNKVQPGDEIEDDETGLPPTRQTDE